MALIYNASFDSTTRVLSLLDKAGNVISSCEVPRKINELTLTATADNSSVKLTKKGTLSNTYEVNTGSGWQLYTFGTVIPLNAGERCKWRCSVHPTTQSNSNYVQFVMTGTIEASGNCNSMLSSDFENLTSLSGYDYAFYNLFNGCAELTKAPELPSTILATSCYHNMFSHCSSLTRAPELPAMTLASDCYNSLFLGCSSLTQVPELPATNLAPAPGCYSFMFVECTALTRAPELPATTLGVACYTAMFRKCTSLIQPPELPASTLDRSCYIEMFKDCSALTQAPSLPATTLADNCYVSMFSGCSSLNEVHCKIPSSYSTTDISSYAKNWLSGVASTGTFYTNADANWSSGASGIPTGWTRVNEGAPTVDDITKPLTFKATQDGSTVTLTKYGSPVGEFQTSRDGGNTWVDYTLGTSITLNTGDEVSFRAKADRTSEQTYQDYFYFKMTGKIEAWHNVMSLYRTNDFATYESVVKCGLRDLFLSCTSLTKAPALPATTLANDCYEFMFSSCQSLTKAPELPATTLVYGCYSSMFQGCQSLTKAPVLPVTTLADFCYYHMFQGCQSLKEVRIAATTTAKSALDDWLNNVSATGDFYCDPNATIFPTDSASGIPSGWTRHDIADSPTT